VLGVGAIFPHRRSGGRAFFCFSESEDRGFFPPARVACQFPLPLVFTRLVAVSCSAKYYSFFAQVLPVSAIDVYNFPVYMRPVNVLRQSARLAPPANSSISSSDAPSSLSLLSSVSRCFPFDSFFKRDCNGFKYLYCRNRVQIIPGASESPSRKMYVAELRTARNAKRVAKEIGYAEKQGRPGTTKHETKPKGSGTGRARLSGRCMRAGELCEGRHRSLQKGVYVCLEETVLIP
jgi:hypothetical protein